MFNCFKSEFYQAERYPGCLLKIVNCFQWQECNNFFVLKQKHDAMAINKTQSTEAKAILYSWMMRHIFENVRLRKNVTHDLSSCCVQESENSSKEGVQTLTQPARSPTAFVIYMIRKKLYIFIIVIKCNLGDNMHGFT